MKRGRKPKPIVAVNPDGTMNGWFDGIMDAMTIYRLDRTSILRSIRTGKPYKGLRWVYKDDYDQVAMWQDTSKFAFTPRYDRDLRGRCKPGYHWQHVRNL